MTSETTEEKLDRLIRSLIVKTESKSVRWAVTANEHAYRVLLVSATLNLIRKEGYDPERDTPYVDRTLELVNSKGKLIEEYNSITHPSEISLDTLFRLARRSAFQTDENLDSILNELDEEDIPF